MRFRATSRKLQIFRFVLIEMLSPCFLNSRVMSFLVRSDCGHKPPTIALFHT